jgi:hypothetical protein
MSHESNSRSIRKIVLPSGRSIEVVRSMTAPAPPEQGLHVCPTCDSHLVQPIHWGEGNEGAWEMTLECPNCYWTTEAVFSRREVDHFEEQLDAGLADMLSDLRRLTQANMNEEIERFAAALRVDLILPEDF